MPVETPEQVKQLMMLQTKEDHELRAICEGLGLEVKGEKDELVRRLLSIKSSPQTNVTTPQAIPLRTRNERSEPLEEAKRAMLKWRKLIFEKGGKREFSLLNNKGKSYKAEMKYIRCSAKTAKHIIEEKWYLPLDHHRDLMNTLRNSPEDFNLNIIQKPDNNGSSWLMLHCCPKSRAA